MLFFVNINIDKTNIYIELDDRKNAGRTGKKSIKKARLLSCDFQYFQF